MVSSRIPDTAEFTESYRIAWQQMMDEGVKAVKSNETLSHINQVDVQIAETPADE